MSVFDILGPVMISPFSFHATGAARIGKITLVLLGVPAVKADTFLHGSFAKTYKSHGIDKALIVGIMGMATDDSWICMALELTRKQGPEVTIITGDIDSTHPDTAEVTLTDALGKTISLSGSSIGGGNILAKGVNRMKVSITEQRITLIVFHRGTPGVIAVVTEVMVGAGVSICNFRLSRQQKGGEAIMAIEIDDSSGPGLSERIRVLPNVFSNTMLQLI